MRRVTLAALAALLLLAVPASASAAEFDKQSLSFDVTVGPNDDQQCTVVADLYTPKGTTRKDSAPAIMGTNGFGGAKEDFADLASAYATRGYVFLAYSGLGFGNSGCKITLDDPDYDGKAGKQLVDFLAGTKAAEDGTTIDYVSRDRPGDPRVGMIGGSYGGQVQFAIAMQDERLDTIVPQITWNDLAYSLAPNNTDLVRGVTYNTPGVTKIDWPVLFTALGVGVGFQQAVENKDPSHLGACPNFTDRVCTSLVTSGSLGYPTPETLELLRHASVASYIERIRIPTFVVQGLSDTLFNINEAVATYQQLHGQGTPVKMLWRSSGHSGGGLGGRESSSTNLESAYESRMALEWFDYYLRGIGDPPALDFAFLRDWVKYTGDAAPAVGVTPSYPASADETVFLSGTDELVSNRNGVKAGTASFAAAPGASPSGGQALTEVPGTDAPGSFASFESAPLTQDLDVVGVPKLTVKLDAPTFAASQGPSPASKLVLFVKLLDVDAEGNTELPRNQLSAVRVADVTKPVEIELPGIAYRFAKGHSLRLVVGTSNATNRGNNVAGPVSIVSDPATPSTLTIPRLGAQVGPTGGAAGGVTSFQPAPGAPAPQTPGKGARKRSLTAASLSGNRRCVKRRAVSMRIVKHKGENQAVSAVITVNGKRVRKVTGRRLLSKIRLERMPKRGAYRVLVTVRTKGGRTLRSARTYRAC